MAQWHLQFTGHTHATHVEDLELSLRQAIDAFREAASSEVREKKAKAVQNLAKRLLAARLRLLKARIAAAPRSTGIDSLCQREIETRSKAINGILIEFGALDASA
ncbi:MAG: hypothetical protein HY269_05380 [Deltaproteobacteria bacterium]|nr:hypothetical protein [Deltaproteobacteria bacterium]